MKSAFLVRQLSVAKLPALRVAPHTVCRLAMLFVAAALVSACGGGGGGDSTAAPGSDSLIPGGSVTSDVSGVSDDQLQKMAANRAGAGLGANLSSLSRLSDDAQNNLGSDSVAIGLLAGSDTEALDSLDSSNNNFLNNSLGIDDPGAMTTREGNIITIDPDDQTVCGGEIPLAEGLNDDLSICQQLVSELMVQIDARSEESGIITYLFQDAPVLLIGYSPMGASYEINLAGVQRVMQKSDALNGITTDASATMSGAIQLTAIVSNSEVGQEAGEISMKVTDALRFDSNDTQSGFNLQPSTVFELALNEATGDISMGVNWGALQLIVASGDSEGNSSIQALNLGALTGELNFNENQPTFQVKNVGVGNVPLNITIDSVESVNLTLANLGITVDIATGMVNLDGALNASLMLNNMMGLFKDQSLGFTASASVSAPANTSFSSQENGSTQVSAGGPLTTTLIGGDGFANGQAQITINEGECFDAAEQTDSSSSLTSAIEMVPCN